MPELGKLIEKHLQKFQFKQYKHNHNIAAFY